MSISVYLDAELAALTALMFRNPKGNDSYANAFQKQLAPYDALATTSGISSTAFPRVLNAIHEFYALDPDVVDTAYDAVNEVLAAYNLKFGTNVMGWGTPGFKILDQAQYLANKTTPRPKSETINKQLAALLLFAFRNSPDSTATFKSFQLQLTYYINYATTLPNTDDFKITLGNIQSLNAPGTSVISDAQLAIADMFIAFADASNQSAVDWGNCAYSILGQITWLAGLTMGFSSASTPMRLSRGLSL